MPKEITKHIIIIGGGVIGASCSYFLSQHEDCKITLIEQADELATGASGKSGGFIALDWCDDLPGMKDLARASYALHQTLAETLHGPERYGYRLLNTYAVTIDPSVAAQRPSRRTDHKRQPLHRRPRGLDEDLRWVQNVKSVEQIGTTETTAQVMPPLFTKTLVEAGRETGRLQLIVGRGVSSLIVGADHHVDGVELEDGQKVYGDQVVVCMGPWSGLLELKPERLPIDGSHVHSVVLQPAKEIPNVALFTAVVSENTTMAEPEVYPRPDGTVYICGAGDDEPLPASSSLVKVNKSAIQTLLEQASHILADPTQQLLKQQACYLPISKETHRPLIGPHPYYHNLLVATGHSFWGILNAPITGKIISELVTLGQVSCLDKEVMSYFKVQ